MKVGTVCFEQRPEATSYNPNTKRSVSLCQIGIRSLSKRRNPGFLPPFIFRVFQASGWKLMKWMKWMKLD